MLIRRSVAFCLFSLALTGSVLGQQLISAGAISVVNDGDASDLFGQSVGLSGNNLLVGIPNDDIGFALERGSSIFYDTEMGNTLGQDKVLAFDGQEGDQFGSSVDISGDNAVVGAIRDDISINQNLGAAYVYSKTESGWTLVTKLSADGAFSNENFGQVVAIDNDTIVVSASLDRALSGNSVVGAVYIYRIVGGSWVLEQTIGPPDGGVPGDDFGRSLSLVNDTLLIGSPGDEEAFGPVNEGSVYVYLRSGSVWLESFKINPNNALNLSGFGGEIASTEDLVAIRQTNVTTSSIYIYERSGLNWNFLTEIVNSDQIPNDLFGFAIDMDETTIVASAIRNGADGQPTNGAVYIFELVDGSWTEVQKLISPREQDGNDFGFDLDLDGQNLAISEFLADVDGNTNQGVVHLFTKVGPSWEFVTTIFESREVDEINFKDGFEAL